MYSHIRQLACIYAYPGDNDTGRACFEWIGQHFDLIVDGNYTTIGDHYKTRNANTKVIYYSNSTNLSVKGPYGVANNPEWSNFPFSFKQWTDTNVASADYERLFLHNLSGVDVLLPWSYSYGVIKDAFGHEYPIVVYPCNCFSFIAAASSGGTRFTMPVAESLQGYQPPAFSEVQVVNDAIYFGFTEGRFDQIVFYLNTPASGLTLAWEYYNGKSWTALSDLVDGTSNLTQNGTVTFAVPRISTSPGNGWAPTKATSLATEFAKSYYIRARVTRALSVQKPVIQLALMTQTIGHLPYHCFNSVIEYHRGSYSDQRMQAANPNVALAFLQHSSDYLYIGDLARFTQITFVLSASGSLGALTWEYWNGTAWTPFIPTDGTSGMTASGQVVMPTLTGWTTRIVPGSLFQCYYIRVRAGSVTKAPIASKISGSVYTRVADIQGAASNTTNYVLAPLWDAANDIDGDGWLNPMEFESRVNPLATARFPYIGRIPYNGFNGSSVGDGFWNRWWMNMADPSMARWNAQYIAGFAKWLSRELPVCDGIFEDNHVGWWGFGCSLTSGGIGAPNELSMAAFQEGMVAFAQATRTALPEQYLLAVNVGAYDIYNGALAENLGKATGFIMAEYQLDYLTRKTNWDNSPPFWQNKVLVNNTVVNIQGSQIGTNPLILLENSSDLLYIGDTTIFANAIFTLSVPGRVGMLTWQYWNGSAWAKFTPTSDGTNGFTKSGTVVIPALNGWARHFISGLPYNAYYIRVSAASVAEAPVASSIASGIENLFHVTAADSARSRIWNLACYYMFQTGHSIFTSNLGSPYGVGWPNESGNADWWFDAVKYNIGSPRGNYSQYSDPECGATPVVYARQYSNGWVFAKPQPSGGGATDESTATTVTLPASGTWHQLNADGSVGGAVTRVLLRNQEAAIVVSKSGGLESESRFGK